MKQVCAPAVMPKEVWSWVSAGASNSTESRKLLVPSVPLAGATVGGCPAITRSVACRCQGPRQNVWTATAFVALFRPCFSVLAKLWAVPASLQLPGLEGFDPPTLGGAFGAVPRGPWQSPATVAGLLAQTVPERVPSTAHLLHLQGRWLSSADACAFFVPSSSGKFHSKGKCSKAVRGMAWSLFNGSFGRSIQMSAGRGCHRRLLRPHRFCRVIFSPGPRSSVHESTPISAITGFSALPESPCLVM